MLSLFQSITVVVLIVAASLTFLWILRSIWPNEQRRQHNDLIGWQVNIIGTTYAVIIGFMLYTVWTNFQAAQANAENEADALVNVVRSARGLPATQTRLIHDLASQYVDVMLTQEWPAMDELKVSPASQQVMVKLWAALTSAEIHTPLEQTSLDHAFSALSEMTESRRLRQLEVNASLPGILWTLHTAGVVVTIVSACLFGSVDFKLHMIQVTMLSLVLSLVLTAIADINRPFQGAVRVSPAAFERARGSLGELDHGR